MSAMRRSDDTLLESHIKEEQERDTRILEKLQAIENLLTSVTGAFPKDPDSGLPDFKGHHDAHRAWIDAENEKRDFWIKLKMELVKWGLIGFCGWLLVQVIWPAIVKGHP